MKTNLRKKLGQNTAEYLIMLTLVAVGSIGLFSMFGKTLRQKVAVVAAAINGDGGKFTTAKGNADSTTDASMTRAKDTQVDMHGPDEKELKSE